MSVANSETVDDADMECSDGEAVDTEDTDEVFIFKYIFFIFCTFMIRRRFNYSMISLDLRFI
jgi:hypothetical protein